jgi:hypothetical protein
MYMWLYTPINDMYMWLYTVLLENFTAAQAEEVAFTQCAFLNLRQSVFDYGMAASNPLDPLLEHLCAFDNAQVTPALLLLNPPGGGEEERRRGGELFSQSPALKSKISTRNF